jgi:nuclear protein localization family protein 4
MDSQFEYKISHAEKAMCSGVEIDEKSLSNFQNYVLNALDLQQMRVGYLYGHYVDKAAHDFEEKSTDSIKVEFIYEPPQNNTDENFEILEDPQQVTIDALCEQLKVVKVGWIFAHPLREKGFHFSNVEILEAAEQQLIAAEGVNATPFLTMKVTLDPEKNELLAEAWQVSKQCMEMAAEGAIVPNENLGSCGVNETFTAYVEGKPNNEIDNNLFLNLVPVKGCTSDLFISEFPRNNRIGVMQSREDLKKQISGPGTKGFTLQQLLGDFQLLLYLTQFLDLHSDLAPICSAILSPDKSIPITEGHALIIRSLAGMN